MSQKYIISCPVKVYQILRSNQKLIGDECTIQIISTGKFSFMFTILSSDSQTLLSADIASALSVQFALSNLTLFFNIRYQNKLHNIMLIFENDGDLKRFANAFVNSLFEQKNQKRVGKDDLTQIDQIIRSMSIDNQDQNFSPDDELFNEEEQTKATSSSDGGHNFLLRVSPITETTMAVRKFNGHCDLDFYSNDNPCKFKTKISNIADPQGKMLSVVDMLPSNSDNNLLILDESQPNEIFDMNLDRGQVVNKINASDSLGVAHKVNHIIYKNQNDSSQQVFVGFNHKNTMVIDPRVPNSIVVRSDYKGNNQFLCAVTTKSGRMATGSADGIVRLYKEPGRTRSTVNFHVNVGEDPIISLDVSPDESWIVAACPNYISTFSTLAQSTNQLAFDFPMKNEKTSVMRLLITQNDQQAIAQANNGELLPFTSAKFDVKNGKVISIIASIGNALVSWNFKSIMNYRIPKYSITFLPGETILDNYPLESSNVLYMSPSQVAIALRNKKPK